MGRIRNKVDKKELNEGFSKLLDWVTVTKDYDVYIYPKANDEFHRGKKRIC